MGIEVLTKDDLQAFRIQLLDDIGKLMDAKAVQQPFQWIRSGELRKQLKLSPATLQNLRIAGKLHPVKVGGTWFYDMEEIRSLFKSNSK